jgi:hypothetical protein
MQTYTEEYGWGYDYSHDDLMPSILKGFGKCFSKIDPLILIILLIITTSLIAFLFLKKDNQTKIIEIFK